MATPIRKPPNWELQAGVVPLLKTSEDRRVLAYLTHLIDNAGPKKLLYTAEEMAWALGFTKSAFLQSDWHKEIPSRKVGNLNRWRPEDGKIWVDNLPAYYPR